MNTLKSEELERLRAVKQSRGYAEQHEEAVKLLKSSHQGASQAGWNLIWMLVTLVATLGWLCRTACSGVGSAIGWAGAVLLLVASAITKLGGIIGTTTRNMYQSFVAWRERQAILRKKVEMLEQQEEVDAYFSGSNPLL